MGLYWGEAVLTGEGARLGLWKRKPKVGLPHSLPACSSSELRPHV